MIRRRLDRSCELFFWGAARGCYARGSSGSPQRRGGLETTRQRSFEIDSLEQQTVNGLAFTR
ncbi:MAG: hypothetical protein E4G89_04180 [Methanothrix sp.]|nr:MAG: hypothetical protein E4G89_04180 [Methanothrix sp.]